MIKIGIVILNYLVYEHTISFVNSIKNQDTEGYELKIIIVDNNSSNESANILLKEFEHDDRVNIVVLKKNMGFANGNNMGYKELLKYMDPDYTIIANDDILLPQDGLFSWIENSFHKYQFGILGPSVYSVNQNYHQSPMVNYTADLIECRGNLRNLYKHILKIKIKQILKVATTPVSLSTWKEADYHNTTLDMTLHGSFLVFSRRYFEKYELPFDEGTFLYKEEDILRLRCNIYDLPMVYSSEYEVNHLQGASTTIINKTNIDYAYFRTKHILKSTKRYIQILEENQK